MVIVKEFILIQTEHWKLFCKTLRLFAGDRLYKRLIFNEELFLTGVLNFGYLGIFS